MGVFFTDARRGWIVSLQRILRTDDGGDTWITQLNDGRFYLRAIFFLDEDTGITVGGFGGGGSVILRTIDGGAHWLEQILSDVSLFGISFSGNVGTAVGLGGVILRSVDGGQTWDRQQSGTTVFLTAVAQADANTATAVGWNGTILRTADGGQSWHQQAVDVNPGQIFYGVSFADAENGIVVGEGGLILRTRTGGEETVGERPYRPAQLKGANPP